MEYVHGGDIYTYGDVLDFSVNVNPYGPSEEVLEAARRSMTDVKLYPDNRCRKLRKRLAEKKSLPEEYFLFGNGAAELFFSVVLAEKPKKALLPIPAFAEYEQALRTVECEINYHELKRENNFALTESFLEELTEDIDLVFLCSPSNPSGQVIEPELLEQILMQCEEKKIRLVLDECFIEFLEEPEMYTMENKLKDYSCLLLVQAFTKMYGIPGLRLGYAMTSDADLQRACSRSVSRGMCRFRLRQQVIEALTEREEQRVQKTRNKIAEEKTRIEKKMQSLGIDLFRQRQISSYYHSEISLFEQLLEQGILIRDCGNYRGLSKGWYRIAVRTKEENEMLLHALERVVSK